MLQNYGPGFPYRLFKFDADAQNPLDAEDDKEPEDAKAVVKGLWRKSKFWGSRPDFGNPAGAAKAYDKGEKLMLVPLGTFILNIIPTTGRGTFKLFYFDPAPRTPYPIPPNGIPGSFDTIQFGHELIPLGNYVLDRCRSDATYETRNIGCGVSTRWTRCRWQGQPSKRDAGMTSTRTIS